jgi:hypothetical protein
VTSKPEGCAECGTALVQPLTGRPRAYCGAPCRRLAERKLKHADQLLARARRQEQTERARAAQWESPQGRSAVKFWQAEVKRCEADLAALLAGAEDEGSSDEAEASAAAATLRSRRRAS